MRLHGPKPGPSLCIPHLTSRWGQLCSSWMCLLPTGQRPHSCFPWIHRPRGDQLDLDTSIFYVGRGVERRKEEQGTVGYKLTEGWMQEAGSRQDIRALQ